jgi:glycine/serine hydroxymethyltransferase
VKVVVTGHKVTTWLLALNFGCIQAITPEFKAYQEQVLSNAARLAKVSPFPTILQDI